MLKFDSNFLGLMKEEIKLFYNPLERKGRKQDELAKNALQRHTFYKYFKLFFLIN